jgi:predicted AlkP superfamily pyrophosphatase or phosphodiesterase
MSLNFVFSCVLIQLVCLFVYFPSSLMGNSIPKRHQTLMISFDGMQSGKFEEFLRDNPNAAFHEIIKSGVKADYMIPSFPTLTFPNHYTLVTGNLVK